MNAAAAASGFSDRTWCAGHGIPIRTFYNRISHFRKKACEIPAPAPHTAEPAQQVIALSVVDEGPLSWIAGDDADHDTAGPPCAITLSLNGARLEISNHACREVIQNTLLSLRQIC